MTRRKFLFAIAPLLLAGLACQTLFPTPEPTSIPLPTPILQSEDEVPRISVREAKAAYDSDAAVFVDTRDAEFYAKAHIPRARSISLDRFEDDLASIPLQREQWIITYCT